MNLKRIKSLDFLPLVLAYILIIVFFSLASPYFFRMSNFLNIALYAANIGVLACTMTLVIISGNIDLSVGAVISLSGVVMGLLLQKGLSIWLAMLACLAVGALTGLYNGFLIAKLKINAFITTLAGMQMFRGLAYILTSGKAITLSDPVIKAIGRGYSLGIPNAVWIMLVMVVLFSLLLKYSAFGRRVLVIGGNPQVAFLSGINVKKSIIGVYVLNGLVGGLGTLIFCSQIGSAMPQNGVGMEFTVISAVILGGASLSGGKGSIVGAMFGALLLGTLDNGMVMMDIQTYWQDVIIGLVLIFAVLLDVVKNRKTVFAQ